VNFTAITVCVTSQRVKSKVSVCFVIDSVRKLLDTVISSFVSVGNTIFSIPAPKQGFNSDNLIATQELLHYGRSPERTTSSSGSACVCVITQMCWYSVGASFI
jgi:hypothetical protein